MYPQLVELQQQLEHQLGKRVELSRFNLKKKTFSTKGEGYVHLHVRSHNIIDVMDHTMLWNKNCVSLLAGVEAMYQRQGLAVQVKLFHCFIFIQNNFN